MNLYYKKTREKLSLNYCNIQKVIYTHASSSSSTYIYLYIDRNHTNFFDGQPLRALATLAFSDNVDLQRSAALAFAEITEKGKKKSYNTHSFIHSLQPILSKKNLDVRQVGPDTLNPILFLLQSHDIEVQRASSAALGNLAVNSKESHYTFFFSFNILF